MIRIPFLFFGLTAALFGQFDAAGFATDLRTKYGPPLNRQTFEPKPGIEMIVDYAANGHICMIQLPALAPEKDRPNVASRRGLEEFLAELVPVSLRGKEMGRMMQSMGAISVLSVQYENVMIAVTSPIENHGRVTASFQGESCSNEAVR